MNYKSAIKFVLPINGRGVSTNRGSFVHAVAQSDIANGRYKRSEGQYLCSQPKGYLTEQREVDRPISCPQCLARIQKLTDQPQLLLKEVDTGYHSMLGLNCQSSSNSVRQLNYENNTDASNE